MKRLLVFLCCLVAVAGSVMACDRWTIDGGKIRWDVSAAIPHDGVAILHDGIEVSHDGTGVSHDDIGISHDSAGLPHDDHVELSGKQMSVVLRYGVDAEGAFHVDRSLVFPMLRLWPNQSHDNLMHRFDDDIPGLIRIAEKDISESKSDSINSGDKLECSLTDDSVWGVMTDEKVECVKFDGIMEVESSWSVNHGSKKMDRAVSLHRVMFPSVDSAYYLELYTLINNTQQPISVSLPDWTAIYEMPADKGVYGAYKVVGRLSTSGEFTIEPSKSLEFYAVFSGRMADAPAYTDIDAEGERAARAELISQWHNNLVLDTPDEILNTMFAFAKTRGAESIYDTRGGLMHGPGGEAYYAAIWANDQAEYINPFFPWLGYEVGNQSALNSFKHFARFMNDEYRPIPSSIISEGEGYWNGAKDRGDAAMIAYGATRYALARGSREEAQQLWPLIEWCLEYCRRNLTDRGVVRSDADELENRFPAGDANLCTSSLYYDALISAVYLGKELGLPSSQIKAYDAQARDLRNAIESHFGYNVEGFDTYRYYEGNDVLRSWICIPLTVGIYDRAEATIDALFSPRLWTDEGCLTQAGSETFWDRSTLYALRGALAAGEVERGIDFLKYYSRRRLLGEHVPYAIEAWPEGNQRHLSAESGLYCRIFTEGLFGLRPTGLRSFEMTPRLPKDWGYANLRHVRAFGGDFDIMVSHLDGGKLKIEILRDSKCVYSKKIKEGNKLTIKI